MAQLILLGRALALKPGEYGELLHDTCTVSRHTVLRQWVDGKYVEERDIEKIPMYWYVDSKVDNQKVFCAYSGYARRIQEVLEKRGINVEVTSKTSDGLPPPDFSPTKAVKWRARQKEVVAKILANRGGVIVCPTGFGKTFLIKLLAQMYPTARILFTVTSADVARRVFRDLSSEVSLEGQVGMVGNGLYQLRRIIVCVAKSLHKCPPDVNLVLADECHELLTVPYIKQLQRFLRARMFGFTASPSGRSDQADAFATAVFGPVLIDVGYQEGVAAGNVVPILVRMYKVMTGPNLNGLSDPNSILRYGVWRNQSRNKLIADVVRQTQAEVGSDSQILIMVDKVEHAYLLGQLLPDFRIVTGPVDGDRYERLKRQGVITEDQQLCSVKDRERSLMEFESRDLKLVIATMVWKQGVDFRDLAVLVRADGLASGIGAIQIPGRLSRLGDKTVKESGLLIDFSDDFFSRLKNKAVKRMAVYRKSGWPIETRAGI